MTTATILYFLGASVALTIAPGPDNIFVLTLGVTRGRKPAIVTALGMCSGISVHTTAAAFGISALFYSSSAAFTAVKLAGAAYLLWLAWQAVRNPSAAVRVDAPQLRTASLFRRGLIMNVLNPKVALFFLAFLPQFITPEAGQVPFQMLLLGLLFMTQAVIIFCLIAYCAGSIGSWLLARPMLVRWFDWLTAGVFGALGVRLALAQR